MPDRILHPEWRDQNRATRYPFAAGASLLSDDGLAFLEGFLLDAILYPVGGQAGLHLSSVTVDHAAITLAIGNDGTPALCTGRFPVSSPPGSLPLEDAYGRPAGLLLAGPLGLGPLAAWGRGAHPFARAAAEFVAAVCVPTPEPGLRGLLLDDGTIVSGDVWLVGGAGVALSVEGNTVVLNAIGDPLFRRALCDAAPFDTPRFVRAVRFVDPSGRVVVATPDEAGTIRIAAGNAAAADAALRITPSRGAIRVALAGAR